MLKSGDSQVTTTVTVVSPVVVYNYAMHISRRTIALLAAALSALLVAACGSGRQPTVPSSTPKSGIQAAYRFSDCMRQHGVSNFPDPTVVVNQPGHQAIGLKVTPAITGSPAFKSAQKDCQGILPASASPAQLAAQEHFRALHLLAFARCIRAHGVSGFPDPTGQGQLSLAMVQAAGVDLHAPNVIAAARACVPASGGLITQAAVSQATGGGGTAQSTGGG